MILRMWYPNVRKGMEERYEQIVREKGAPYVSSRPGCLFFNLVRSEDDPAQYVVVSKWESKEQMRAMVDDERYQALNKELAQCLQGEAVTRLFEVRVG